MYTVRMRCGKQLAHEAPVKADIVSTVPESATPAAMGYAQEVRTTETLFIGGTDRNHCLEIVLRVHLALPIYQRPDDFLYLNHLQLDFDSQNECLI